MVISETYFSPLKKLCVIITLHTNKQLSVYVYVCVCVCVCVCVSVHVCVMVTVVSCGHMASVSDVIHASHSPCNQYPAYDVGPSL